MNNNPLKAQIKQRAITLNVNPYVSAENPIIAGPIRKPENAIVVIFPAVIDILSLVYFNPCIRTTG